jgi:adenosylcobinamide kinase / adenosylcobinamide-phosphate guanylyltransferase
VITLVLGGARSGKSEVAERLARRLAQPVTYVATAVATDEDMASRIAAHRSRRPAEWATVEAGAALVEALEQVSGSVLVDSLGTWMAATPDFGAGAEDLCAALGRRDGDTVVVSEEVGLGVHPFTEEGRRFRDALGGLNQAVAALADKVILVVAGRQLPLEDV